MIEYWAQQSGWMIVAIKLAIVLAVFVPFISLVAMIAIWAERKVAGHMQARLGPTHVGPKGILQSLADGVKLIMKEDLVPAGADQFLFRLAPYLAFTPVFAAYVALPFGPQFTFESGLAIGVLYLLAVLAVEVMSTILAGWGSNSKWAVYGAMREACQMVSYEVPLGLSIICGVLVAGTLNLNELGYLQGDGLHDWFVFHNPFIFLAFILYFIASVASNKRAPFDLPESESELVAGFHTEYSGIRFSLFFFAEYAGMFVVGGIQAFLFLGGWNSPAGHWDPIYAVLGYDPTVAATAYFSEVRYPVQSLAGETVSAQGWAQTAQAMGMGSIQLLLLNLYCAFWVVLKASAVIFVQMWLRWTLPRIRIDQVLYTCVKVLLPASLIALLGTAGWVALEEVARADAGATAGTLFPELLAAPTPLWQLITQIILTVIGGLITLACFGVIVAALVHRRSAPPRSFFPEVMPVGREIAFTKGEPKPEPAGA